MFKSLFRNRNKTAYENIDTTTLKVQLENANEVVLIDVRSAEEYASGHITGSRLLPLPTISTRYNEIPKETPVVITCRSGARSRSACEQLSKLGFTNLSNLQGGVMAWKRAGLSLSK